MSTRKKTKDVQQAHLECVPQKISDSEILVYQKLQCKWKKLAICCIKLCLSLRQRNNISSLRQINKEKRGLDAKKNESIVIICVCADRMSSDDTLSRNSAFNYLYCSGDSIFLHVFCCWCSSQHLTMMFYRNFCRRLKTPQITMATGAVGRWRTTLRRSSKREVPSCRNIVK